MICVRSLDHLARKTSEIADSSILLNMPPSLAQLTGVIHLLMLLFFVGGLVRLLTVAYVGWPHWFYIAMIVVEIATPLVYSPLLRQVTERPMRADLLELTR
jgi:Domain of unknown function (DUF4345)